MGSEMLSIKWNGHKNTFFDVLATAREKKTFCDATIACEGNLYSVHRFVISTCSTYFEKILENVSETHPVIVLADIKSKDIEDLLQYMYTGEIKVLQEDIDSLIKAGEVLKIKGIGVPDESEKSKKQKRFFNDNEERSEKRQRSDEFGECSSRNESIRESKNKNAKSSSESCNDDTAKQKEIDGSLDHSVQPIAEFTAVKEEVFQPSEDSLHFPEQNIKVEFNESLITEDDLLSADSTKEQSQQLQDFKQAYGSHIRMHQVDDDSYKVGHSSASSSSSTTHQAINHQKQDTVPTYTVPQEVTWLVSPDTLYRRKLQNQYSKERPFKCDQCTASFIDPAELLEHKKEHSRDGPFTCEDCRVTFVYKNHFRSHKRRCSNNIYEKIYFGRKINPKPPKQ